jgi:hypothetical protein
MSQIIKKLFYNCPQCSSEHQIICHHTFDEKTLYLSMNCTDCNFDWVEAWTFAHTQLPDNFLDSCNDCEHFIVHDHNTFACNLRKVTPLYLPKPNWCPITRKG